MAYELSIDKCHLGVVMKIETLKKIMKKYGDGSGSRTEAIRKACEASVAGVRLTAAEYAECEAEFQKNYEKRMKRRADKKSGHVIKKVRM